MTATKMTATINAVTQKKKKLVSIVIPVFNEGGNIQRTFKALDKVVNNLSSYEFEFLFLDNHSTDNSFELIKQIAKNNKSVRAVRFSRNFGFQKSVLSGYRLAHGDAAIQIDADLQDPPELLSQFLKKWEVGHDVVVGIRRHRQENLVVHKCRKMFYWLISKIGGEHIMRDAGDFRLIDKTIISHLQGISEPHFYLRGLISSLARNQIGIPYDRQMRTIGESKFGFGPLFRLAFDAILAHSSAPLKISFYVGILTASIAVMLSLFYIVNFMLFPTETPAGFTTTQILLLFGIGLNSIFLGIIGVYVGRVYDQIRTRPITIVSEQFNFEEQIEDLQLKLNN